MKKGISIFEGDESEVIPPNQFKQNPEKRKINNIQLRKLVINRCPNHCQPKIVK